MATVGFVAFGCVRGANLPEPERLQVLLKLLPYVLPKVENARMDEGEPIGSNWGVL